MEVIKIKPLNIEKTRCTGCGSCANACSYGSIVMRADEEGFLYPNVDTSICTNCRSCVACCPVINPPEMPKCQTPIVYAAWSLDEEVRYNSTSGGIFTELAKAVLQQQGYVAGARYINRYSVEHALIDKLEDIALLRQSKYIQSETKDIYKKVKEALQTEYPVLFVGTPCQCAGLKVFLQKPYENLFFCDFICRGVNSPMIYQKYLEELEATHHSAIKQVWFKNKIYGWNKFCTKVVFENGDVYLGGRDSDPFMYGYIKEGLNLYMRPSCALCEFKGLQRPVDITLGDFWGVNLINSSDDTEKGVSAVIVHTKKGMRLFNRIKDMIYFEPQALEDVLQNNKCLTEAAASGLNREYFFGQIFTGNNSIHDILFQIKEQNKNGE